MADIYEETWRVKAPNYARIAYLVKVTCSDLDLKLIDPLFDKGWFSTVGHFTVYGKKENIERFSEWMLKLTRL